MLYLYLSYCKQRTREVKPLNEAHPERKGRMGLCLCPLIPNPKTFSLHRVLKDVHSNRERLVNLFLLILRNSSAILSIRKLAQVVANGIQVTLSKLPILFHLK